MTTQTMTEKEGYLAGFEREFPHNELEGAQGPLRVARSGIDLHRGEGAALRDAVSEPRVEGAIRGRSPPARERVMSPGAGRAQDGERAVEREDVHVPAPVFTPTARRSTAGRKPGASSSRAPSIRWAGASEDTIQLSTTEPTVEPMKPPMAAPEKPRIAPPKAPPTVSYTPLRAHETVLDLVCRLLLEKKETTT